MCRNGKHVCPKCSREFFQGLTDPRDGEVFGFGDDSEGFTVCLARFAQLLEDEFAAELFDFGFVACSDAGRLSALLGRCGGPPT